MPKSGAYQALTTVTVSSLRVNVEKKIDRSWLESMGVRPSMSPTPQELTVSEADKKILEKWRREPAEFAVPWLDGIYRLKSLPLTPKYHLIYRLNGKISDKNYGRFRQSLDLERNVPIIFGDFEQL